MPAHIQSTISDAKMQQLRQLQQSGRTIDCAQVFEVRWPQPTGTRYYAKTPYHLAPNFASIPWKPIEYRIVNNGNDGNIYPVPFSVSYEQGNDTLSLDLIDHDQYFRKLFGLHPEGAPVHVWLYIPQINWSGEIWWGLLDPPGTIQDGILKTTATFGTRSPLAMIPGRVMSVTTCHASSFFGGSLKTQSDISKGGCPYNAQIGGSVGNLDPVTGKFFTSCDGTSEEVCLARIGGNKTELPILRFSSILATESVAQSKGGSTQASTRGNESALNVPCPVIVGERILRELPPLTFQIQANTKHPEKGSVSVIFPVSDSGVVSLTEPAINDTPVTSSPGTSQNQFLFNLGKPRQKAINLTGTQVAANYSNVAHWRGLIFGNFAGQSASNFKGKIKVAYPRVMGHEAVGVIEIPGPRGLFPKGTRVVVDPGAACGYCHLCRADRANLCPNGGLLGRDFDGVFAEYLSVPEIFLHPLPDAVSSGEAPLLQVLGTCVHAQSQFGVF
ncbi:MAG: alcohol dehydrogenase catalytic domain-containing protein, partial [Acidobacteriota bacterium]